MSTVDFKGVEDTLFIPLAARVLASRRFPNYFYDEKSLQFENLEQVKKTGNQSAMMYFYINDAMGFCEKENIDLILERGFFAEARKQLKGLKLYSKIAMKVVEDKKRVKLLHVKL